MNSKEVVKLTYQAFSDKRGEDIRIIDIQPVPILADYLIIADGNSPNQAQVTVDNVKEILERVDCERKQIKGYQNANWILMDYKDVVVHIFCREDRLFYDLERIWRDGKTFADVNEL